MEPLWSVGLSLHARKSVKAPHAYTSVRYQCLLTVLMTSGGIMNSTAGPNTSKLMDGREDKMNK